MTRPLTQPELKSQAVDPAVTISLYLAWGWMMVMLVSIMLLLGTDILPGGRTLAVSRAVFHSVSAATLTGYTTSDSGLDEFSAKGQAIIAVLTALGALTWLSIGGIAAKRLAGIRAKDSLVVLISLGMVVFAAGVGLLLPPHGFGSLLATLGALGNSGVSVGKISASEPLLHAVLLPLVAVGGLGSAVVLDVALLFGRRGHALSWLTRLTAVSMAVAFLGMVGLFYMGGGGKPDAEPVSRAVALAGSAMGYGLPIEYATAWPRPLQVLATLATVLGLGLGGTAAGLSVTSAALIVRDLARALMGRPVSRLYFAAAGQLAVLAAWIVLVFLGLLASEPQISADRLFTLAASSASDSALAHDPISSFGPGLFLMSLSMMLGRALPVAALWLMVHFTRTETPPLARRP
jgi:Trk-type K+ transport system membrane component